MIKLTDNISFIGKIDWERRTFHGEQMSTNEGSSFNAYFIKDEKNVVIDGVYKPFADEYIADIEENIGIENIDYIIALHAEPDHSSALLNLLELRPDIPIYCTAKGVESLKGYYHKEWNFKVIKTGDTLKLGNGTLTFIECPFLHWPDQMIVYYDIDKIIFSSDIFGQHYSTAFLYDNKVDKSRLEYEALKYYANIVSPFSSLVIKKLDEISKFNLDIKLIAPSHGVIWTNSEYILGKYTEWANTYAEEQVILVYDSMYGSTRRMAEYIAEGISEAKPNLCVKIFSLATADESDVVTEAFRSKAVLVGSPTYNGGLLTSVAGFLEELKGIKTKNKKAAAFGSYGWAAVSVKIINERLKAANFEVFEDANFNTTCNWRPNNDKANLLRNFGIAFANAL